MSSWPASAGPLLPETGASTNRTPGRSRPSWWASLADAELARLHDRLPDLNEKQQAEIAATVHRTLRKVLHQPTVRAKELSSGPAGPHYLEALRQLFGLNAGEGAI